MRKLLLKCTHLKPLANDFTVHHGHVQFRSHIRISKSRFGQGQLRLVSKLLFFSNTLLDILDKHDYSILDGKRDGNLQYYKRGSLYKLRDKRMDTSVIKPCSSLTSSEKDLFVLFKIAWSRLCPIHPVSHSLTWDSKASD
jgi:hypothetical protein